MISGRPKPPAGPAGLLQPPLIFSATQFREWLVTPAIRVPAQVFTVKTVVSPLVFTLAREAPELTPKSGLKNDLLPA